MIVTPGQLSRRADFYHQLGQLTGAGLGLIQALVVGYLSPSLADVIPYIILLAILIIKPYGLFGLVRVERL